MKIQFIITIGIILFGCTPSTSKKGQNMNDSFKNKEQLTEILSHADYNIIFNNSKIDNVSITELNIGNLNVPTGKIVVCDPLVLPETTPLKKTIKPGHYPIKIYVAHTKESGDRYAIAKLEIKDLKADKWVLALREGEKISDLKDKDDFFGFPVDAGLGGFFDHQAGIEYNKFIDNFMKENPDGNIYDDLFSAEFKKNGNPEDPNDYGDWINFQLPESKLNITMFHSGFGDGVYPAYWGISEKGEIVSLVIDFFVLLVNEE